MNYLLIILFQFVLYYIFVMMLLSSSFLKGLPYRDNKARRCSLDQIIPRLFYFYIFRKHFLQKYIFNITIYSFVPLPPGRGAAGGLPPGRGAAGGLPPSSGAAGTYM